MPHNNMPHNNMQGGMFGAMGGSQNMGGMSERELAMMLGSMQGNSPTLPNYSTPAPPSQVPGIRTTGIDPSMMRNTVGGGLDGIPMTPQGDSMGGMQDAIMSFGQRQLEDERLRKLLETVRGGGMAGTLPPGLFSNPIALGGGGFSSVRGGRGPTQIPTGIPTGVPTGVPTGTI
jgi:hypothetical protein